MIIVYSVSSNQRRDMIVIPALIVRSISWSVANFGIGWDKYNPAPLNPWEGSRRRYGMLSGKIREERREKGRKGRKE